MLWFMYNVNRSIDKLPLFYIGGEWVASSSNDRLSLINPATEESIGQISLADEVDVELVDNGEDDNEEMVNKRSTFIDEIDARMSHF